MAGPEAVPSKQAFVFCGGDEGPDDGRPARHDDAPASSGQIRRLLIVEDDWFIGMELETILREGGYEVVDVVPTADQAIEAAIRHRPDLILMDIRLASIRDGIEAAIEIRRRTDIGSIFVSAHQDEASRERAAPARPAGWVGKPFTHSQILEAIKAAHRRH